ncbi:MAG: hypothetical protein JWQ09_3681 [Segetibacter sp.]|nr:hypothetical protein [Segetibacter sp.]
MKTPFLKLLLSVIIACFLFGCKKTENPSSTTDPSPLKIVKQVTASSTDFVSYEYDASGNVTKSISQWQNGASGINRLNNIFEYNGNKLVKFSNEAGYALFTYTGNVIASSDNFAANGRKLSTILYQYDGSGKITNLIEQNTNPAPDAISETKVNYQYYSNGNVSRIDFSYRKQIIDPFIVNFSKVFVEYDDKKNPEPDGVLGFFLPGVVLQKNNPVKINNVPANGTVEGYSRYEYTYNAKGYPVNRKHFIATSNNEQPPVSFAYSY